MRIPFGTTGLELSRDVAGAEVLESAIGTLKAEGSEDDIVRQAMANPIGSVRLADLAKGKKTATIIVSDHTRPVPSKLILPPGCVVRQSSPREGASLSANGCNPLRPLRAKLLARIRNSSLR